MSEDRNAAAREQARAQLASICEMVAALECDYGRLEELRGELEDLKCEADSAVTTTERDTALDALDKWIEENQEELDELIEAAGDCQDADEARQRIEEGALSVEVRSGWRSPGEAAEDEEFCILLCTGGPACQIIGELGQWNQPSRARLMFQDWGTPWEELVDITSEERDALLTYCQVFYFGG